MINNLDNFRKLNENDALKSSYSLNESVTNISEGLQYHIQNNIPLCETVFRLGSPSFFNLFKEARELYKTGKLGVSVDDKWFLEDLEIGNTAIFNGIEVQLDCPFEEDEEEQESNDGTNLSEAKYKGKEVQLNKPKRGGKKKYYVYTKNDKGNVIKVAFGDVSGGLSAKINDPEARASFAARHDCENKNDKTTPGYWSCRLPRFAKLLGLKPTGAKWW